MRYLLDTVTLIRHFSAYKPLGKRAQEILMQAESNEDEFYISVITLMEIMYLAEKKRIPIDLAETLKLLENNAMYKIVDLNQEILLAASTIEFYEIHDRLILATAKWLDMPIISSDSKFPAVADITVIWD